MSQIPGNWALAVSYEQIVLQSHSTYRKKSFIEKLNISNQVKKKDIDSSNLIAGMLILDKNEQRLIFRPNDYMPCELYYQDHFFKKMTVKFNNIKNIIFITKNKEYITFKSAESITKSYQSFIICCYDFRIYRYNRLSTHNKTDAIKFYQYLYRILFENNVEHYKCIPWENIPSDLIQKIYHTTISKKIKIKLKIVKSILVLTPQKICEIKNLENYFEFGPQLIYHSNHNESYLFVIDKSAHQGFNSILERISEKILPTNNLDPVLFYLNNENSYNKTDFVFPTTKELNESFEKLFNLCTPRNKADFKRTDKKWMTKLSDCGWLSLVNRSLQLTKLILKSLSPISISVYMIENSFPVWGWVFGSLVQIICQPLVRTFHGFLSMIEKNWILSGAYNSQASLKPQHFLLFLDCVYQLLRFSPFQFEFNEEMLICLYDLFTISPPGFMSSQDYQFQKIDWNYFFVDQVLECFENRAFNENEMNCCLNIQKVDSTDFGSFWFKMYARWIPYVQVEGGSLSERHFFMITSLDLYGPVYSNYPFSLNYDKITVDNDYNNNDDTRSINTVVSDS